MVERWLDALPLILCHFDPLCFFPFTDLETDLGWIVRWSDILEMTRFRTVALVGFLAIDDYRRPPSGFRIRCDVESGIPARLNRALDGEVASDSIT